MLRLFSRRAFLFIAFMVFAISFLSGSGFDLFAEDAYDNFVKQVNSYENDPDSLKLFLDSIENQLKDFNEMNLDYRLIWHFNYYRAYNYTQLGNYEVAFEFYDIAFEIAWVNKNDIFQMHTELSAGNAYYRLGYYRMAKRKYEFALKKAEEINNENIQYKANHNLGIIAKYDGEYDISLKYFEKAKQIREEQQSERELGYLYNNLGTLYSEMEQKDKALEFYSKSEKYFSDGSSPSMLGKINNNIGNIYMEKGEIQNAKEYFSKSLQYKKEGSSGYVTTLTNLGILYLDVDNELAFTYLDSARKICLDNNYIANLEILYSNYLDFYESKGNYEQALEYLELRLATRDSIFAYEKELQLADIRSFYDLENKSNRIKALKYDNAIKSSKLKINKLYMIIGSIILVLAIISIITLTIRQKHKRKDIQLLIDKRDELEEKRKRKRVVLEMYQKMQKQLEDRIQAEIDHIRNKDSMIMIQSRHSTMGEMIGNIAHQWRQPINAIGIIIQDFADAFEYGELDDEYFDKKTKVIDQLIEYMEQTIDDFKNFFQPEKRKKNFLAGDVLKRAVEFVSCTFQARNIEYKVDINEDIELHGISNEFFQVVLNIMNNAKDAFKLNNIAEPRMVIEMGKINENLGFVKIQDNAGGIEEQVLDKHFEPYITTKEQVKGTGMGLYIAMHIIKVNFAGEISAINKDGGACFIIKIPLSDSKLS